MVESWESEALLMQMPVKISSTKSRVFIPTIKVIILELMCICANCICCVNSLQEIAIVYHPQPSARDKFLFLGNAPNQGVQGYDISMCQLDNLMKRTRVPWKLFFQYILSFWSWASHVTWLKQFSDEAQSAQQAEEVKQWSHLQIDDGLFPLWIKGKSKYINPLSSVAQFLVD